MCCRRVSAVTRTTPPPSRPNSTPPSAGSFRGRRRSEGDRDQPPHRACGVHSALPGLDAEAHAPTLGLYTEYMPVEADRKEHTAKERATGISEPSSPRPSSAATPMPRGRSRGRRRRRSWARGASTASASASACGSLQPVECWRSTRGVRRRSRRRRVARRIQRRVACSWGWSRAATRGIAGARRLANLDARNTLKGGTGVRHEGCGDGTCEARVKATRSGRPLLLNRASLSWKARVSDRYCPHCGLVLFDRISIPGPPEDCPRCAARGRDARLIASQPRPRTQIRLRTTEPQP